PRAQQGDPAWRPRALAAAVRDGMASAEQDRVAAEPLRAVGLRLLPGFRGRSDGVPRERGARAHANVLRVDPAFGHVSRGDGSARTGLTHRRSATSANVERFTDRG